MEIKTLCRRFLYTILFYCVANPSLAVAKMMFGAGFSSLWNIRQDYGQKMFYRFSPEAVFQLYLPFSSGLMIRPAARIGYAWQQPEMPQSLRIEETDWTTFGEVGVSYNWYVIPTVVVGGGYDFRKITLKASEPLSSTGESVSNSERLGVWYVQGGIGVPIENGFLMLEPVLRYHKIQNDERSHFSFGVETTVQF